MRQYTFVFYQGDYVRLNKERRGQRGSTISHFLALIFLNNIVHNGITVLSRIYETLTMAFGHLVIRTSIKSVSRILF